MSAIASLAFVPAVPLRGEVQAPFPAAVRRDPIDALLSSLAADHTLATGPSATELAAALRGARFSPRSSDAFVRLADALSDRARATFDPALYAPVEQIYLHAYKLDSTNHTALVGLAWAAGAAHRFNDSIAWATLALRLDPDLPEAHAILGDAALELGHYPEAQLHYERLQTLRPGSPAYARLAQLLYQQGHAGPALQLMRRALDEAGGAVAPSAWYASALALMHVREGAAPIALSLLEFWRAKIPDDVALLNALGAAHIALDQDELALAAYHRAAELRPQHSTLFALYELHLAAGRQTEVAAMLTRIDQLTTRHHEQGVQGGEGALARFYADAGIRSAEAVRLAQLEAAHHRTLSAQVTLAWALHRDGRTVEAAPLLPGLLRGRAPEAALHYYAATIAEAAGDAEAARTQFAAAFARQPRWSPVHTPLARAALDRLTPRQ